MEKTTRWRNKEEKTKWKNMTENAMEEQTEKTKTMIEEDKENAPWKKKR